MCFKYPKSDSKDNVIDGLSFVIPAGSICVIVGENGCGKSSTLKLLTRTYDITEGDILIDDKPIQSYKVKELRDASAIMHQDYLHFKFSVSRSSPLKQVRHSHTAFQLMIRFEKTSALAMWP